MIRSDCNEAETRCLPKTRRISLIVCIKSLSLIEEWIWIEVEWASHYADAAP